MPKITPNSRVVDKVIKGERAVYSIVGHSGLVLNTRGDGNGSWVLRYRVNGKQREHRLHNDARNAIFAEIINAKNKWLSMIKFEGADPKTELEKAAAAAIVRGVTFGQVFDEWVRIPREKKTLRPRTVQLYRWLFNKHLKVRFGAVPIAEITRLELRAYFEAFRDRIVKSGGERGHGGRGEVAGKAFTYSKAAFDYAVDEGDIAYNPMASLKRPIPTGPDRKATRPLRPYELRAVWTGIDQCQPRDKSRMIKLALLLGRRRTEIAAAEIEELHLDETEPHWLIKPREGNKSSIDSLVPLPPAALKIIREAVADACNSRYLFPAPKNLQKPTVPDSLSLAWRRLCNSVGVPDDVDLHGARDLITDSLLPMGTPSLVISYVLHHSSDMKSTVALKNYRTFEFRAEKLRALRLWQARLHNIVSGRKLRVLRW